MSLYNLIGSKNYLAINKTLIKNLGIETAYFFTNLIDFQNYLSDKEKEIEEFYYSREEIEKETQLTAYKQKESEKKLIDLGFIEINLKGIPARNFYKINSEQVLKIFEIWSLKKLSTGTEKNSDHSYNQNPTNQNSISIKKDTAKKEKIFNAYEYIHFLVQENKLDTEISDLLFGWLEIRKIKKTATTQRAIDMVLSSLNKHSQQTQKQMIENSIKNGWTGIFELKPSTYPTPPKKRLYEPSSKTNIDYSQGMVDGTVEEMREFFGIEN